MLRRSPDEARPWHSQIRRRATGPAERATRPHYRLADEDLTRKALLNEAPRATRHRLPQRAQRGTAENQTKTLEHIETDKKVCSGCPG